MVLNLTTTYKVD